MMVNSCRSKAVLEWPHHLLLGQLDQTSWVLAIIASYNFILNNNNNNNFYKTGKMMRAMDEKLIIKELGPNKLKTKRIVESNCSIRLLLN